MWCVWCFCLGLIVVLLKIEEIEWSLINVLCDFPAVDLEVPKFKFVLELETSFGHYFCYPCFIWTDELLYSVLQCGLASIPGYKNVFHSFCL
ncbi:hypothetical protein VNO80_10819 [Phaseolus coccineus]|uniref:Uncharacterized protein n=1 Tax=Phaseolus coccineus TaxID=3886 RepID=A0AAN9N8W7_PHACN